MDLKSFFSPYERLLKLATKPSRNELWLSIKLCIAGVAIIGVIGFLIELVGSLLQGFAI